METKQRLSIMNQFIGYGNPDSNVWFVGSEESKGCLNDDELIIESENKDYSEDISLEGCKPGETYYGYKKILEEVFNKKTESARDGQFFVTNLWPWGKKEGDKDFSPEQRDYYDFKENLSLNDIKNLIYKERFSYLKTFFDEHTWKNRYIFFCIHSNDIYPPNKFLNKFISKLKGNATTFKNMDSEKVYMVEGYPKIFNPPHAAWNQIDDETIEFIKSKI